MKKTAASLIIFTKIPHKGLVAILSRRGEFDYEKFRQEKYANLYEATAGGRVESSEHLIEGLLREVDEELGGATAKLVKEYGAHLQQVSFLEHRHAPKPENTYINYTYSLFIPHFPLQILKPHRGSAGVRLITEKELALLKPYPRNNEKKGPTADDHTMWMFPDQLNGLKRAFELYKHL